MMDNNQSNITFDNEDFYFYLEKIISKLEIVSLTLPRLFPKLRCYKDITSLFHLSTRIEYFLRKRGFDEMPQLSSLSQP